MEGLTKFLAESFRASREAAAAHPSAGALPSLEEVALAASPGAYSAVEARGPAATLDRVAHA